MQGEKKINDTGFNRFFKNSIAVMLLIDPDTLSIADANPAAEKFYGWSRSRLAQMSVDQINTLSSEAIEVEIEKATKQERAYFRFKHRKADGTVCPVEVFSSNVEINGKAYLHSIIHDISKTIEAEQKLQENYKLLKNLTAQVPGVVYQYRLYPDGRSAFPVSSPGMWDIYEVTPEQVQEDASPVFTRLHPDDYDYIVESINESAKNLTLYHSEFRVILPKQGLRWRKCDARPEKLDDGSTLWHGIITDITDLKNAEKKLHHAHQLMQYIIEHNKSAVAVHDRNMNYIYVSQRYIVDYNVKEKDLIGRNHYDVFPDLPQKWRDVHQRALNGEVIGADNDPYYRNDGTVDYTRWECRPWHEADGSIGGIIVYTEVINELIKREQEIKQLNERLKILIDVEKELSSAKTIETIQQIVTASARKLTGSEGATIVFKENDFCHYVYEDAIAPLWKGNKFPVNKCISGWSMEHNEPVVISDIYSDDRIPIESYKTTFVKSLVMVPVSIDEPIGAIGNYWDKTHKADEMEVALIETLADATARAIENIQLQEGLESKIEEKTKELKERVDELERFYNATIEREFRIKELRDEINRLKGNA